MMAAVAVVGRPSVSNGTSVRAAAALVAAMGPATKSASPTANMATEKVVTSIQSSSCGTAKARRLWPVN
jgi:hypothetical protein